MHKNYRRKIKYKCPHHPWSTPKCYRQLYWRKMRAIERNLLSHERWDDVPNRHPKSIMYDYW